MKISKPIYYTNDQNPIKQFWPIIDKEGNIYNDLCITDDCKLYYLSDLNNNNYISDCPEANIKIHKDQNGRLSARLIYPKGQFKKTNMPLHRVLMILSDTEHKNWNYEDYKNLEVDHINPSIPVSNNLSNLRFVSHNDNMYAAGENGVMIKKYKKSLIHDICDSICNGESRQEIMKKYNINGQLIDDIKAGRSHKSVSSKYIEKGFRYNNNPRRPREERIKEAENICYMLSKGFSNSEICRSLNVASGLVTSINKGISYKDISKKYGLL